MGGARVGAGACAGAALAEGDSMRLKQLGSLALLLALVGCGGVGEDVDTTVATVTPVRGQTQLGEDAVAEVARASVAGRIRTPERGLARVSLDSGPRLLLGDDTELGVVDGAVVELGKGRLFAEVQPGEQLETHAADAVLRASDASFSAELEDGALSLYVIRGEVSWTAGDARGVASAGERLRVSGEDAEVQPATLWTDWTGGLARPGPSDASAPEGVGTLEGRVPDEIGRARWPLTIRRLDVRVRVEGNLAITEVDQLFFNPASETVEGLYRVRVPESAVLQRFAVDRDSRLVDGYVRERAQARQAYQQQVYRGSVEDPALLEWDAPGSYRARIYPIQPGETRRIVIRYAEWLRPPAPGAPRLYRYPMGAGAHPPHIQELSISADVSDSGAEHVRAGMGAQVEHGAVRIRRSDFRPRADFWMELVGGEAETQRAWTARHEPPPRAPDAPAMPNEADERDYFYLPLVLPASLAGQDAEGLDLVVLEDVSAGTDRSHLELGRSVVESIAAHLDERDRVAIVTSDLRLRPVSGESPELVEASRANVEGLLDALARVPAGGATDLGQAIEDAAALLDPSRPGAIVYVGDGTPTVGELRADGLLERMARLPSPVRLYAVAVGSDANLELLQALTRGGGLALRVEERAQAADAALRLLAHAERPVAHHVEVELGDGIENAYPRRPMDAVIGDVFPVVGRVRGDLPASVTVRGSVAGQDFEQTIAIQTASTEASTDLRLRWAGERLHQLLLDGAGREEVAELGTRYGLITPFTSYYVPSRNELARMGWQARVWIDRPLLPVGGPSTSDRVLEGALAIAIGPLSLAGCSSEDEAPASHSILFPPEAMEPEAVEEAAPTAGAASTPTVPGAPAADMALREQQRLPAAEPAPPPARQEQMPMEAPEATTAANFDDDTGADMERAAAGPQRPMDSLAQGYGGEGASDETELGNDPTAATGALMDQNDAPADLMDFVGETGGLAAVGGGGGSARAPAGGLGLRGTGRGGGGRGGGTVGLGDLGTIGHGAGSGSGNRYGAAGNEVLERSVHPSRRRNRASDGDDRGPRTSAHARRFVHANGVLGSEEAAPDEWQTTVTRIVTIQDPAAHRARRCSDAANLLLDDRRALWRERLSSASNAAAWLDTYREAIRRCEAPTWRDRRALLSLMLARAGSIDAMLSLYRLLSGAAERDLVRAQIFRRVRTPDDLRTVRGAFGLGAGVDWTLVEQILARATTESARIRALRRLSWQYPESFDLKLRLLAALERASRTDEAKRFADRMRADPLADPGVRTAIGEMFLRLGREDDARRAFSEIVEFAPLDELARRRLGDLYRAHGWFEDAYRQYQTLIEIRPDDPTAKLLLAQAAAGAGRVDEALRLERGLMQTAQPGASQGIARTALLWSSVRFARLEKSAQAEDDGERLEALARRLRRSGVLRESAQLRVTLVWSHPDAQLGLWAGYPGLGLTRPTDISPELGLEAFDVEEQEQGAYRIEVRRSADEDGQLTAVTAQLVVVWNEGEEDEKVELVDLTFDGDHQEHAWTISGRSLTETSPGGGR